MGFCPSFSTESEITQARTLDTTSNVTLLEAPWANHDAETDVCWPYPEIVDGYALPLEGPGLGIEADEASVDEALVASKPFVLSLQPRLNGLDGSVRDF
jgi:L-alanine-DL-glutamate epimerase-like enolase superfamily enzyme